MGWTLQSLIDADMTVAAHCQRSACNHSQLLDLVQLRDRFGPDMPVMRDEPWPRLQCSSRLRFSLSSRMTTLCGTTCPDKGC
jgi:hypothetical protein